MFKKVSENIHDVLKTMEELEKMIEELYMTCSQIWSFDNGFWTHMELAERKHARNMNKMIKMISEKPESFVLNPQFKSAAIKTAFAGIKWHIQRLKKNEIAREKMLYISRDIEQSLLEKNYNKVVRTNDAAFESLMNEIVSDTAAHHDQLNKKIEEGLKGPN
jgi:hypothetical protein